MSENTPVLQDPAAAEKSGGNNAQKIVIAILVLAAALMLAWQFVGCANCYAGFYTGT